MKITLSKNKGRKYKATTRDSFLVRRAKMLGGFMLPVFVWVRRLGIVLAIAVLVIWLGAWLWLSGSVHQAAGWSRDQAVILSAQAGMRVENILVEGRVYSDPDILLALMNIEQGDPLFRFDPDGAAELIGRMSWVREVNVQRRWPDTIYVGLTERVPIALWKTGEKLFVIDEQGETITDYRLERFRDLMLISGGLEAAKNAGALITKLHIEMPVYERAESAAWIGGRRWDVTLKNGIVVKLPEEDMGLALRRLARAQEQDALLDKDILSIDLRDAARMIVRTRPGAVREYKADLAAPDTSSGNAI